MNKIFYPRLAAANLRKNQSIYLPYLLAGTLLVALHYILSSVTQMVLESGMEGAGSMAYLLMVSTGVCGALALVVLFYVNSFVIKRRKREFGLYSILGMEKRHILLVMLWEVLFSSAASILLGIAGGALLSQLMFLLLLRVVGIPAALRFSIPLGSVAGTAALFAFGFLLVLLYDAASIRRADPIALLHSDKPGEREPKTRRLAALLGVLSLGAGYGLALAVRTPSEVLGAFLFAVVLVILGTYLLFLAGSIALLKLLRGRKRFYYRPQNFIAVSGMIYRMKQNAMGLASICILSTCVLVTLSSSVCLYLGEEDILQSRFPRQVNVACRAQDEGSGLGLEAAARAHAGQYGLRVENARGWAYFDFPTLRDQNRFSMQQLYSMDTRRAECVALADYNRMTGSQIRLAPGEVLVRTDNDAPLAQEHLVLGSRTYRVRGEAAPGGFLSGTPDDGFPRLTVVLPQFSDLLLLRDEYNAIGEAERQVWYDYWFDLGGDRERLPEFYQTLRGALGRAVPGLATVNSIDLARESFYQIDGSILFVGIFFVLLFLIATVLIIYYKQVTEGFDDHDRFQIMEKVGMSDREVRSTIQKQVLMVFFLPLGMAVLHIAVAFPVLCKMLTLFSMTNTTLFLLCTLSSVLFFTAFYFAVYLLTARVYYRIVQGRA